MKTKLKAGRHKIYNTPLFIRSYRLTDEQHAFVLKNGGASFIRDFIDLEMKKGGRNASK